MTCITLQTKALSGFLYQHVAEQMPDDLSDEEFEAWCLAPGVSSGDVLVTHENVQRFIGDLNTLVWSLEREENPENYMTHFYDAAKSTFDGDTKLIRIWFMWLYVIVFGKLEGPRWGDFVQIYGRENFIAKLDNRLSGIYGGTV